MWALNPNPARAPFSQEEESSVRIQSSERPAARTMMGSVPRKFFTVAA